MRSARIQTMGMTHLEHELKKPLATMISVVNGILEGKDSVLCPRDTTKLTMVKARLMKMADITDTMLTSKDFCIDDKPGSDRSEIRDGNDDRNVFIDPALRTGGLPDC